jgi:hypothetical protein
MQSSTKREIGRAACPVQPSTLGLLQRNLRSDGITYPMVCIVPNPNSTLPTADMVNLQTVPVVLIPSPKIPLLNRSTSQGFISNPSGSGYIAGIEVFHHLHCLNMLRQAIARDLYPPNLLPSMFRNSSPAVIEKHVGHCVETLRQALMCTADVTPYLVFEGNVGEGRKDREDFEASHKCRNFGGIRGWMLENGIPVPEGVGD